MKTNESIAALEALIAKAETIPDDYQFEGEGELTETWRSPEWVQMLERGKEALAVLKGATIRRGADRQ